MNEWETKRLWLAAPKIRGKNENFTSFELIWKYFPDISGHDDLASGLAYDSVA